MRTRKWLIILLAIVTTMSLATYTGVTRSFFIDDEQSTNDTLGIQWGLITLTDGFEGTPWDQYWDENATTDWTQDSGTVYSGTYSAKHASGDTYLTSDEIDASASTNIAVSFWFNIKDLNKGPLYVQIYDGMSYNNWYDLVTYPGVVKSTWIQFSQTIKTITDPQYFIAGFSIRFDGSTLATDAFIDDVLIVTDSIPPAAPQNLAAAAGEEEVDLDWDDNSELDLASYNIYRSLVSLGPYTYIDNSTDSEFLDTGLTNDTTYYYVVTAVDTGANESGNSNEASATPIDMAPAAPQNLSAVAGDRQVSLNWDDNSETDLASYNVYRSESSGGPYDYIDSNTLSDFSDEELTGVTTYYYVVTAVDGNPYESDPSDEVSATPNDDPPAAPQNLSAGAGDRQVDLDWDDNGETDLAGYNIYRSLASLGPYDYIDSSTDSDFTDEDLTGGTAYYYVVTAVDGNPYESDPSDEVSATPNDDPPAAPQNLSAGAGDRQVDLDWDDNGETDLDDYKVYRSLVSLGPYDYIGSSSDSDFTDEDLNGGTTYYYVVTAVDNGSNESGDSNEASATPTDSPPAAPQNLSAAAGERQVSLDWDDNGEPDLDDYKVYRSEVALGPYSYIGSNTDSDFTDEDLNGGTTYYYVVTAVDNGSNESGDSNEASATPTDSPPAAPGNLSAAAGERQVSLDWDDNGEPDLDDYKVYRSEVALGPYSYIGSNADSDYVDTGLTGGTTYYYVVTAVDNGSNESGISNEASATPTDTPPAAPQNLSAVAGERQVDLDWDDNGETDLAGYNIYRSEVALGPYSYIGSNTDSDYVNTGLTGGTTYYYVVTAVDSGSNESGNSNEASATPTDSPPAAPQNLSAVAGERQVSLDWDDNSEPDLAGYNIYRSLTTTGPYNYVDSNTLSEYIDSNLTGGTTYYYVVTAVDSGSNESGNSNEASATPSVVTLINDGFEDTPWDAIWDGNGITDWTQDSTTVYSGTYSAGHASGNTYLTSDNLNTADAASITVSFWFQIKDLNKGPLYVQIYNGSTYDNWYDLVTYPGVVKNTWIQFSQTITDPQYFIAGFSIRFDGSTLATDAFIDDVLIEKD